MIMINATERQPDPDMSYCKKNGGCSYLGKTASVPSCDYIGLAGRRRGCSAREGCTKHTGLFGVEPDVNIDQARAMIKKVTAVSIEKMEQNKKSRAAAAAKEAKALNNKKINKSPFDQDKAMELYKSGLSDGKIGESLGVSSNAVCYWRKKNNLKANIAAAPGAGGKRVFDPLRARELYNQRRTDHEIALELGVSAYSIGYWRRQEGLPFNQKDGYSHAPAETASPPESPEPLEEDHSEGAFFGESVVIKQRDVKDDFLDALLYAVTADKAAEHLRLKDVSKVTNSLADAYGDVAFEVIADSDAEQYRNISATINFGSLGKVENIVVNLY